MAAVDLPGDRPPVGAILAGAAVRGSAAQRRWREGRSARAGAMRLKPRVIAESELAAFGEPERLLLNVNDRRDLARAAALLP